MAFLEGTAQSAGFIVVSQTPDICKSPSTPIPYNIVGFLDKSIFVSADVRFQGFRVFDTISRVATVVGNEAGIGGGVASQTNLGMCKPVAGPSTTVFCNGNQICRHDTAIYEMNLLGSDGSSNTIGKVYYLGAMMSGPVGPKGTMPNGANGNIPTKTDAELSALDKIKNSLSIDSIEDAVSMSQKAYDLSKVDWGNPSAALGALGGMASRAKLGDLAAGIGAVNKAMNTDWDDPASVLAAAGAMAGPLMSASQAAKDYFAKNRIHEEHSDMISGGHSENGRPDVDPTQFVEGPDGTQIPVYEVDLGDPASGKASGGEYGVDDEGPYIKINNQLPVHQRNEEIEHELDHAEKDYENGSWKEYFFGNRYDGDLGMTHSHAEITAREREIEAIESNRENYPSEEAYQERLQTEQQRLDAIRTGTHKDPDDMATIDFYNAKDDRYLELNGETASEREEAAARNRIRERKNAENERQQKQREAEAERRRRVEEERYRREKEEVDNRFREAIERLENVPDVNL